MLAATRAPRATVRFPGHFSSCHRAPNGQALSRWNRTRYCSTHHAGAAVASDEATSWAVLRNNSVVFGMRTGPSAQKPLLGLFCESAITATDANGPIITDSLEVKRWVIRIGFEELEVLPRKILNLRRQLVEQLPEVRACEVSQSLVLLPAA